MDINDENNNIKIEYEVFQILKEKNLKIGFCESCTGGLISSRFSSIPGVSEVFDRSIITYSNASKIEEVGVNPNTLAIFGAVSQETALEMANGLLNKSNSLNLVLSVTGIAGPDGGTKEKPIGLVYICIYTKNKYSVFKYIFKSDRENIQSSAATQAFLELKEFLLNI